jgi:hypothetical protein
MGGCFFAPGKKKQVKRQKGKGKTTETVFVIPAQAGIHFFSIAVGGGGIKLNLSITITVPDRLAELFIALTLFYRRVRYGYPFRRIPLTQEKYAIVDPEDFERLNKHKWHASKWGNTFYAIRCAGPRNKTKYIRMHREIIHPPDHLVVDHINHNGLDNRKANIRPATRAQNNYNRLNIKSDNSSSKYKGVSWRKRRKRWRACIYFNGKYRFLGYFKDEIQAAKAYDKAAKIYHGEFATLNFPD